MKIFLTGATGFVGAAVLKRLAAAGHTVKGLVQSVHKAEGVRKAGGIPVFGDLLVPDPWTESVKDCDLVISASSPFGVLERLSLTEAERRAESHAEMVGNLLKAASKSKVQAVVLTYHVTAFGNQGDRWASEILTIDPVGLSRPVAGAYWEIEKAARHLGVPTIEVFPGWVYGPGSWFAHFIVGGLKTGVLTIVGPGANYKSLVHISDLAEGFKLIVDKLPIGERYCLVDGHPVTQKELITLVATEMGLKVPESVDYTVFASNMGDMLAEGMVSSVRVTSAKAKKELGFNPAYPSYCQGVPAVLSELGIEPKTKVLPKASGF
jgi:nucleoside-diphosphate-sugar epimerase